jgi:hypothetical protein
MTDYNKSLANVHIPARMRQLPITAEGWPQLYFAAVTDGKADLRVADPMKKYLCYTRQLCWLCGQPMGRNIACVLGPMCVVTRTTSEPGCHLECAQFAAVVCPFLTRPRMTRNDRDLPEHVPAPGMPIMRNPGCCAVYVTRELKTFKAGGGVLFRVGDPTSVHWYCEGRVATRKEVQDSINSGMPALQELADKDPQPVAARHALLECQLQASALLPDGMT